MAWLSRGAVMCGKSAVYLAGWQRQDHSIARLQIDPALPEVEVAGVAILQADGAQALPECDLGTMMAQEFQGRFDQARRQAHPRDQRAAAGGAPGEALPQRRPEQPGRARLWPAC